MRFGDGVCFIQSMDLITQGIVGAAMAQATRRQRAQVAAATACGFIGGLAPDIDALIRSPTDPLVFLEFHRHFTHALAFVPIGGLVCGAFLHLTVGRRWQWAFWQTVLFCTIGYATHGLLDAMTSYGTSLFWPLSDVRVSWSLISIIDPLFTLPAIGLVILCLVQRQASYARAALLWMVVYLCTAAFQHNRALDVARGIAAERGHAPIRVEVKPSFGNILVWRTIYETDEAFYVDAVRAALTHRVFEGVATRKLVREDDFPWLDPGSQQARDIERFRFFSRGYIARDPDRPNRIIDIRYAFVPNTLNALWSVEVAPDAPSDAHVTYLTHRDQARANLGQLWRMIANDP